MKSATRQVFINVPFDNRYKKLFDALVFAVQACGLEARCALEGDDSSVARVDKLYRIIGECQFGIHDLSRVTLDSKLRLPRFNMPLELGMFLGARRFGGRKQRSKVTLILDSKPYRYQAFCSDIAGQDVRPHSNEVRTALQHVRNWLREHLSPKIWIPGTSALESHYVEFRRQLPFMCEEQGFTQSDLTFVDYKRLISAWIEVNELQ